MEHLWSRADANGGKRGQVRANGNGSDEPKPLPPAAVSCAHKDMVRRGSTVPSPSEGLKTPLQMSSFGTLLVAGSGDTRSHQGPTGSHAVSPRLDPLLRRRRSTPPRVDQLNAVTIWAQGGDVSRRWWRRVRRAVRSRERRRRCGLSPHTAAGPRPAPQVPRRVLSLQSGRSRSPGGSSP